MTEVELAKALRKSNYTCEGVNCEECKKTNSIHQCLMRDVQVYCDDILGADDNYIEKLEKENEEWKKKNKMTSKQFQWCYQMTLIFGINAKNDIKNIKIRINLQKNCKKRLKRQGKRHK